MFLKLSTAGFIRYLMQDVNGNPITGLTPAVTICKGANSNVFAAPAGTGREVGNGIYEQGLTAADTSVVGPLNLHATGAGASPYDVEKLVVAFDYTDAALLGLSNVATLAAQTAQTTTLNNINTVNNTTNTQTTAAQQTANAQSALTAQGYTTGRAPNLDRLDVAVSTRMATFVYTTPPTVASIAAAILATPANLLATDATGRVTVGVNADKAGYALTVAPPTTANIAAAILLTPANLLATDTSNRVTTANPSSGSAVTEATIWAYATRSLTAQADTPGTTTLLSRVPSAFTFTGANVNAAAQNLPTDYQQRAVAVTLPTTPPAGYGGSGTGIVNGYAAGQDPATLLKADSLFAAMLKRGMIRYSYVEATKAYQPLFNDGTADGAVITLTVAPDGTITQR